MTPLLLFLLACGAIYIGTIQAAFNALMRVSLRLLAEDSGRSPHLARYLEEPLLLFVPLRAILGLIEGVTVLLLANMIVTGSWPAIVLLAVSMVAFGAICEFLVPFLIVSRDPERVIEFLLPSFRIISRPLGPLTDGLLHLLNHSRRERGATSSVNRDDVNDNGEMMTQAPDDGGETSAGQHHEERKLLKSIVDFGDTLVREVMTPRPDIVAIPSDATLDELRALFREQEYSRIPVYKDHLDNILGFVFVKDLILLERPMGDQLITSMLRPVHYVPETKLVSELLREFQRQRIQMAIVVDEYGGTAGLVTIEDLVEEIVGEIRDEYDVEAEPVVDEGNGSFLFSGAVDVDEIAERLGVAIEREGFETVGGFLLSHLGRVPAVGETFDIDSLRVEVIDAERRRVRKVRISRAEAMPQRIGNARE